MTSLLLYVGRRLLWTLPTLLLVSVIVFALLRMIPGDPTQVVLGDNASTDQIAALRAQYGLDRPIPLQFVRWLSSVVQGDLGQSITTGQAVLPLIVERFQVSATIVLGAIFLAVLIAVPTGLYAAQNQNTPADTFIVAGATTLLSIPSFWLGLLFLHLFGSRLGWVPVVGYVPFSEDWQAAASVLVLPIVTLALVEWGALTRMVRASVIEAMRQDFVTHARAKGLRERTVLLRHVLPNAFAPTWTLIGLALGNLLGGIAVLETVFTLPGLGRLLVDAIFARDYPLVQGCLLLTALIYVLVNLIVDLCYPMFDPQVAAA